MYFYVNDFSVKVFFCKIYLLKKITHLEYKKTDQINAYNHRI